MKRREFLLALAAAPFAARAATPGRMAGNSHMLGLGDSRTFDNYRNGYPSLGPLSVVRQLAKGQVVFDHIDCLGFSGADTTEIRSAMSTALASEAMVLALLAGTNDSIADVRSGRAIGNLRRMAEAWASSSPGRIVLLADECPAGLAHKEHNERVGALRDELRALEDPTEGIYLWPTWNAIATEPDGFTPRPFAYRDDLHWGTSGAWAAGRAAWQTLRPLLPTADHANGPASWRPLRGDTPGVSYNDAVQLEVVRREGENWLRISLNGDIGAGVSISARNVPVPVISRPGYQGLRVRFEYEVAAGTQGLRGVSCILRQTATTPLYDSDGAEMRDGAFVGSNDYARLGALPADAIEAALVTPSADIPPGVSVFRWEVNVLGFPGQPCRGVVMVNLAARGRVEDLRWAE